MLLVSVVALNFSCAIIIFKKGKTVFFVIFLQRKVKFSSGTVRKVVMKGGCVSVIGVMFFVHLSTLSTGILRIVSLINSTEEECASIFCIGMDKSRGLQHLDPPFFGQISELDISPLYDGSLHLNSTLESLTTVCEYPSLLVALIGIHRQTLKIVQYVIHPSRMSTRLCETMSGLDSSCKLELVVLCPHHTSASPGPHCTVARQLVASRLESFAGDLSVLCCECDYASLRGTWCL